MDVAAAASGPAAGPRPGLLGSARAGPRQRGARVRTSATLRAVREQRALGREIVSRSLKRHSSTVGLSAAEPRLKKFRGACPVTTCAAATAARPSPSRHKIDQKALLRRVLRVVHPDKYMAIPLAREVNSQSLKVRAASNPTALSSGRPARGSGDAEGWPLLTHADAEWVRRGAGLARPREQVAHQAAASSLSCFRQRLWCSPRGEFRDVMEPAL